jgi:hypothetical protein
MGVPLFNLEDDVNGLDDYWEPKSTSERTTCTMCLKCNIKTLNHDKEIDTNETSNSDEKADGGERVTGQISPPSTMPGAFTSKHTLYNRKLCHHELLE